MSMESGGATSPADLGSDVFGQLGMLGIEAITPGPGLYFKEPRLAGKDAPAHSFGLHHSDSQFISAEHQRPKLGMDSPAPCAYEPKLAKGQRGPAFTFANSQRKEAAKFISSQHAKEHLGMGSPGPAHSGSSANSTFGRGPAQPFGTGDRPPLNVVSGFPVGPGSHTLKSELGKGGGGAPSYSFGSVDKQQSRMKDRFRDSRSFDSNSQEFARQTFGGDWDAMGVDSKGKLSCSTKPTSARYTFPRAMRSCQSVDDGKDVQQTPGPGSYEVKGASQLSNHRSDNHTLSSTSTLFSTADREMAPNKKPFISSAHARENRGREGPGPARYEPSTSQTKGRLRGGAVGRSERLWSDQVHPISNLPLPKGLVMPGPGSYTTTSANSARSATHVMGSRNPTKAQPYVPGPGAYSPIVDGNFGSTPGASPRGRAQSARDPMAPTSLGKLTRMPSSSTMRGTHFHGAAPRVDRSRFISPWHAKVELNGADQVPGPQYELGSTIGQRVVGQRTRVPQPPSGPPSRMSSSSRASSLSAASAIQNLSTPRAVFHAPAHSFGAGEAHNAATRLFISAQHSKENMGVEGPGPGAYSPRRFLPSASTPRTAQGKERRAETERRANDKIYARGGKFNKSQRLRGSPAGNPGPGRYEAHKSKLSIQVAKKAPICSFGRASTHRNTRDRLNKMRVM